jgi:hypothetical protein
MTRPRRANAGWCALRNRNAIEPIEVRHHKPELDKPEPCEHRRCPTDLPDEVLRPHWSMAGVGSRFHSFDHDRSLRRDAVDQRHRAADIANRGIARGSARGSVDAINPRLNFVPFVHRRRKITLLDGSTAECGRALAHPKSAAEIAFHARVGSGTIVPAWCTAAICDHSFEVMQSQCLATATLCG